MALYGAALRVLLEPTTQSGAGLADCLVGAGIRVANIVPIEPTLEDVFVSLIDAEAGTSLAAIASVSAGLARLSTRSSRLCWLEQSLEP